MGSIHWMRGVPSLTSRRGWWPLSAPRSFPPIMVGGSVPRPRRLQRKEKLQSRQQPGLPWMLWSRGPSSKIRSTFFRKLKDSWIREGLSGINQDSRSVRQLFTCLNLPMLTITRSHCLCACVSHPRVEPWWSARPAEPAALLVRPWAINPI